MSTKQPRLLAAVSAVIGMPISPYYSRTIFQHAKFDQRDLLERMLRIAQLLWQHP
jgi:hypothetical protein